MIFYRYQDRKQAGQILAEELRMLNLPDPLVLALPRGGVPIGDEMAKVLHSSLDVLIVRKIGSPMNPEYGIGAMSEDFRPIFNAEEFMEEMSEEVKDVIEAEKIELVRRIDLYRQGRKLESVKDKSVILVDDGLATGITAAAGAKFLKDKGARNVTLAVPVGPRSTSELIHKYVDQLICPYRPSGFMGVGMWYSQFDQVTDEEVMAILEKYHPKQATNHSSWM